VIEKDGTAVIDLRPGPEFGGRASFDHAASGSVLLAVRDDVEQLDFGGTDLADKVVVFYAPRLARERGLAGRARMRAQVELDRALRALRPAAALLVDDGLAARGGGLVGPDQPGKSAANVAQRARDRRPNVYLIGRQTLAEMLAAAGVDEAVLDGGNSTVPLRLTARIEVKVRQADAPAWNVVAVLEGSDAALAGEYVGVGCHLDHLGVQEGIVYPGADDDGSGSAGLIAVAKMFASNPTRPRRSLLFMAFCGEERGLIGSRYLVEHPPVPLANLVAELQMDMIGRSEDNEQSGERADDNLNSLHLIGTEKVSRDIHRLCLDLNRQRAGFDLEWDEEDVFFRSDHVNFAKVGIPIAFFFTGFHRDYHAPGDTLDKIDHGKLLRVATYVYDVAFELAQQDGRPHVDADLWRKNRGKLEVRGEPMAPVRAAK
jgi:hypothetical protein